MVLKVHFFVLNRLRHCPVSNTLVVQTSKPLLKLVVLPYQDEVKDPSRRSQRLNPGLGRVFLVLPLTLNDLDCTPHVEKYHKNLYQYKQSLSFKDLSSNLIVKTLPSLHLPTDP